MRVSKNTQELLEDTIKEAINSLIAEEDSSVVTDIYISVSPKTGEVLLFDDNEDTLSMCTAEDLIRNNKNNKDYYDALDKTFSTILNRMESEETFQELPLLKPFIRFGR